jgi:hypothetical protein
MDNTFRVSAITDAHGRFFLSYELGENLPPGGRVWVELRLLEPAGVIVDGVADVEDGGGSDNLARSFEVSVTEPADLGEWNLGGGDNIKLFGGIGTPREGLMLSFEVHARAAQQA